MTILMIIYAVVGFMFAAFSQGYLNDNSEAQSLGTFLGSALFWPYFLPFSLGTILRSNKGIK